MLNVHGNYFLARHDGVRGFLGAGVQGGEVPADEQPNLEGR